MTKPSVPTLDSKSLVFSRGAAYVNVSILVSIVVICVYATTYLNNIEHAVGDVNKTLKEVKAQLAKQDGRGTDHSARIIRLEDRYDALLERVKTLEQDK